MKTTIADLKKEYLGKIDALDLDLILTHILKKPREFVLAHPEHEIPKFKIKNLKLKITRRRRGEPLAYILGFKEFFGYPFLVSPATLIPRPETEMMVGEALAEIKSDPPAGEAEKLKVKSVIDVGTGSGNIIVSVAKATENFKFKILNFKFYGIDISSDALRVARRNAKKNNVAEKIKFLRGDLLAPLIQNSKFKIQNSRMIILANLPYLSKKIYDATKINVKKFEPKSALYSANDGLAHYEKLFKQIALLKANEANKLTQLTTILEFSPEQKKSLSELILKHFPKAKTNFKKDLTGKWRLTIITL